MEAANPQYMEMLRKCDSPTVSNVIELFKVRPQTEGFLNPSIRALFPELPPMVGYAVTMKVQTSKKYEGPPQYNDIGSHVEALLAVPAPRVMVIQDLDEGNVGAAFGELVAATYIAFGCVGIVTSGGGRDTPAIHKRKLPLFVRTQVVSHGYTQCLALNVPVEVGGVTIKPGDLLHGDADGVVMVPIDLAPQIAVMCERFVEKEREWMKYVESGNPTANGVRVAVAKYTGFQRQAEEEIRRKVVKTE